MNEQEFYEKRPNLNVPDAHKLEVLKARWIGVSHELREAKHPLDVIEAHIRSDILLDAFLDISAEMGAVATKDGVER